jgi:outer membrane protein TolC
MVLSGLLPKRAFAKTAFAVLLAVTLPNARSADAIELAGTMPEDTLPGLKTILQQAMTRAPEQIARSFERVMQEARLTMSKSAQLPSVGGNFDYGLTQTATASNTSSQARNTGAQYSFNLGQALFHWGAIRNEIEISRLSLAGTDKESVRVYRDVCTTLRKAYLALIVEKTRLRATRESLALVEADLQVARTRLQDGTISGAVLAGEELRLRDTKLQLARVATEFEANRARFSRAAGLPEPIAEDAIPDDLPKPAYPEPLAAAIAAQTLRENARGTPEFEYYDLKLQEALLRQKIVATRLLPKFGVGAGYSLRTNTYVNGASVNQEAVTEQKIAVSGSWNIFDGFATGGAKREAAAARRALEHRKSVEIDQLLQNLQLLERNLRNDAEQLELAEIRLGIALKGQEILAESVALGTSPKADLRRGEANILQARAGSLEARAVLLGRWSDLVATSGRDPVLRNLPERHVRKTN